MHVNTRSLYPKIDQIRYDLITSALDILGITESWLKTNIPDRLVTIQGYNLIRNDREGKRGGGTCLFINSRLRYEVTLPCINTDIVEMQCISLLGIEKTQQQF